MNIISVRRSSSLSIVAVLSLALELSACDKAPQSRPAKQADAHNRSQDISSYAGQDICEVDEKLDASDELKKQFIGLFGEARWNTWVTYSGDCGPIQRKTVPQLGDLLFVNRVQLVGSGGAYGNGSAVLFVHPNGKIEAACFAEDENKSGYPQTDWIGQGWHRTVFEDQCESKDSSEEIDNLRSAKTRLGNADILDNLPATVGRDSSGLLEPFNRSQRLKEQFAALFGDDKWDDWTSFIASESNPILAVQGPSLYRKIIILHRFLPHDALTNGTILLSANGKIVGACMVTDDESAADWRGQGWRQVRNGEDCDGDPARFVNILDAASKANR